MRPSKLTRLSPVLATGLKIRTRLILVVMMSLFLFATTETANAECPNENLRDILASTRLPDCRAYEMVTPPYKEGFSLFPLSYATNGDQAIMYSFGSLAEARGSGEATPEPNLYLDHRDIAAWKISSLNVPLTSYVGQVLLAYEATSGLTLWSQHTPQQAAITRGLYIRDIENHYNFIGMLNPTASSSKEESDVIEPQPTDYDRPVAATKDFRHILLFAPSPEDYWTNIDKTVGAGGSLYEYSGTGNSQPTLVGVTGNDKGSTNLIGKCGVQLGSGTLGSAYNALSEDGETVFFTVQPKGSLGCASVEAPEFAEIYVRIRGGHLNLSQATTVDIGESECSEKCGGSSGKNFEGASRDGTKVFFTSTQKLTNGAADGTEEGNENASSDEGCSSIGAGPGCNLYLYDFDAPEHKRLTVIAGEVLGVASIAENGSRVYFVSRAASPALGENPYGQKAQPGHNNLYVYDAEIKRTTFITTLGSEKAIWQKPYFHPVQTAGEEGRFFLFASAAPEVTGPDDTSSVTQLFEYRAAIGTEPPELVRVTKGEDAFNDDGNAVRQGVSAESIAIATQRQGRAVDFKTTTNPLNISADGDTVVFQTAGGLSPLALSAVKGCSSVYEFHTDGPLSAGSVHLLSDGRDVQPNKGAACGAEFLGMDGSGANVLISTADPLVPGDSDGVQRDVYDVRVDGGFPPVPVSGESGQCVVGGCEGSSSGGVFSPGLPSSLTAGAEGNVAAGRLVLPGAVHKAAKARRGAGGLSKALRVCRREHGERRRACERRVRHRYSSQARGGRK